MMYYWHIMHFNEDELVYKLFKAQSLRPSKNDWALQILQDKKDLNLEIDDEDVKMQQNTYSKLNQNSPKQNISK